MIITPKKESIIKLICIIILLILNLLIYFNGKNLSCDKCEIRFMANKESIRYVTNEPIQDFKVNITNLFKDYKNKYCLIKWNREQGGFIYDYTKVK